MKMGILLVGEESIRNPETMELVVVKCDGFIEAIVCQTQVTPLLAIKDVHFVILVKDRWKQLQAQINAAFRHVKKH